MKKLVSSDADIKKCSGTGRAGNINIWSQEGAGL